MPRLSVNGTELYYEEYGEGIPILGVHGTPGSALTWMEPAKELAKHGRCIIYDRRGFHRSAPAAPPKSLDLVDHVDDAAAVLAALGAGPAVVVGRSTGGLIALDLALRFPDKVKALVLLEPALFTIDPDATAWARRLRLRLLEEAEHRPELVARTVMREVLGDDGWESLPDEAKKVFDTVNDATLAELRGHGMDLSEDALELGEDELASIRKQTLILSARNSPEACRLVNSRLSGALPYTRTVLVEGGHLIDPAHPAILDFVDKVAVRADTWT